MMHQLRSSLVKNKKSKILLLVLDGVGGLPFPKLTELEAAKTPTLDKFVKKSETGAHTPIISGITPGSGSAHLALFGYDPLSYDIGRGVLEALGLDVHIGEKDLLIRGNFASVKRIGSKDIVTDRRAGRISTKINNRLVDLLNSKIKKIDQVGVKFVSGLDHRFVCKLSFKKKLDPQECMIIDTDPEEIGVEPVLPNHINRKSSPVSKIVIKLIAELKKVLKDEKKANFALLRGFSVYPEIPKFKELYNLEAASIVTYPMYKGISKLVGMNPLTVKDLSIKEQVSTLKNEYKNYDFFYFHIKKTDSYGEDGNYKGKIKIIEDFDKHLKNIMKLNFDVVCITGDHSTPSKMKSHSWHPVPVMINSKNSFYGTSNRFTEKECIKGNLGLFEGKSLMNYILAHADMLAKFGA
ncbi:2,3-bisphosphoglycerate-independent phosphoglycerate mutase [bacterium]|nr:2,3-bisphosphoglycerate-independent phosphoglycerate mutase [bacterium]